MARPAVALSGPDWLDWEDELRAKSLISLREARSGLKIGLVAR
jgi:hypothetical protein